MNPRGRFAPKTIGLVGVNHNNMVIVLEPALQSWGRRRSFVTKSDITLMVIRVTVSR